MAIINAQKEFSSKKRTPRRLSKDVKSLLGSPHVAEYEQHQDMLFCFGDLLRALRQEAGLSQAELARISGISKATICNIELAVVPDGPRLGTINRLLRACGFKLSAGAEPLDERIKHFHKGGVHHDSNFVQPPSNIDCDRVPLIDLGSVRDRRKSPAGQDTK